MKINDWFRRIVKLVCPPLLIIFFLKIGKIIFGKRLFDGDDALFMREVSLCRIYGEYGCGQSTMYVLKHSGIHVYCAESSASWAMKFNHSTDRNGSRRIVQHIDLGETGDWGRPLSYSHRSQFSSYTDWIWSQDQKPDLVLIDGRFRVCCFLTSLKFANEGTVILFDDYRDRRHYHIVEKYVSPDETCGRQSKFIVPPRNKIDFDELEQDIASFRLVMD